MKKIIVDNYGKPRYTAWFANDIVLEDRDNEIYIPLPECFSEDDLVTNYVYYENSWLKRPDNLASHYIFEAGIWKDIRDLARVKDSQWELIKSSRNGALTAPLATVYGVFDADLSSQKNITDAVSMLQTMATAGYPQTVEYTLHDNTVVTLSTAQMIEVGLALGQRTQQIYATARLLRSAIDAAATIEEVESIVWLA